MKTNLSQPSMFATKVRIPAVLLSLMVYSLVNANQAIVILFEQVGGGCGGHDLRQCDSAAQALPLGPIGPYTTQAYASSFFSLYWLDGSYNTWFGGTSTASTGITSLPLSASGDTFGYAGDKFYFPGTLPSGTVFTPATTWTWSQNLSQLGLDYLTTTPVVVFESFDGQTVSLAMIPEPSSAALLFAGCALAFVVARRRKR
ncbi:MAG: PEP-CTERM sorting domain-containing protein [Verrucomicrobia bacterium]|nr:PEP-CTERM sorting domain-containing protein [Verrucomicrobiota bacterium]